MSLEENLNLYVFKDALHDKFDLLSKPFLKEIVLLVTIYIFYANSTQTVFLIFLKYIGIFMIIRYILSVLTEIKSKRDQKRYFILNVFVIIFSVIMFLMNKYNLLVGNIGLTWLLIVSYCLIVVSTGEHYSSDIILTLLAVYSILNNTLVSSYVE